METKPYSLQAPEQIAKGYAGNKQKIGEAAKMGLIDPTAAVLAGMFIDRMRSAQMQEQGPQQTVAQQVLSPTVPPMSPQAPSAAPAPAGSPQAGLGAIAPQGGGMAPSPPQGPVGMAAGGYVGDQNFGSTVNGTYNPAGAQFNYGAQQNGNNGAMFSRGMPQDSSNGLPQSNGFPQNNVGGSPQNNGPPQNNGFPQNNGPQQNNGGGFPQNNGPQQNNGGGFGSGGYAGGIGGSGGGLSMISLPPAMFDEPRNGGFNNGFNNNYAGGGIVGFAEAGEVDEDEVASGNFMSPIIQSAILPRRTPIAPPVKPQGGYDAMVARASAPVEDSVNTARKMMGADTPQPGRDALRADIAQRMSPEAQRKNKEELMWTTLAQIGAGMASTKSPSFLQAAGDAMQAALPGMIAEKRAQKLDMREALKDQAAMEGMDRQEQREYVKLGMEEHSRNQQLLMEAKKLAEQGRIADANRKLQEYEIAERSRTSMAGVAAQYASINKPPANIQELDWAARNPTKYKEIQDAQRNPASNLDPFGGRLNPNPTAAGGPGNWLRLG